MVAVWNVIWGMAEASELISQILIGWVHLYNFVYFCKVNFASFFFLT